MIEAVGFEYLRTYFGVIDRMLLPEGRALLQAIVIRDQDEAEYRRNVDFIQRYIFPGGALPITTAPWAWCTVQLVIVTCSEGRFTRSPSASLPDLITIPSSPVST